MNKIKKIWMILLAANKPGKAKQLNERSIEALFEELGEIQVKMNRTQQYLDGLADKESLVKHYEALDKEALHKLDILAGRAKTIEDQKKNLRGRLVSNNAALARIGEYEDAVPDLIKEMQVAEKRKRETEAHIYYLEEEKEMLYEERESLLMGYHFLKGFSMAMVIGMIVCLFISFALLQMLREQIWMVLTIIGLLTVVLFVGVLILKDKLDEALSKNVVLQQKAVKYLNKAKIRLFNQVQYLEFQYHKLGIDSVAKLELYYNRYLKNKNNERIYLQMNERLNDIEEEMLSILKGKGIQIDYVNNLSDWHLTPKKLNELQQMKEERVKTAQQMQDLKTYEEEIWKEIYALGEEVHLKEKVADAIAQYNERTRLDKIEKGA